MDYPIETKFKTQGKFPVECTVIDIHKTYNKQNELVKTRYVATHKFLGQTVTDYDVVQPTIGRGLIGETK